MLVSEWIAEHNVTVAFKSHGKRTYQGWECKSYTATVTNAHDYTLRFPFRTGTAVEGPDAASLFLCLASDARLYEEHNTANDVMATFGMEDHKRAERLLDSCNETATALYDWATSVDMYIDLLQAEEG